MKLSVAVHNVGPLWFTSVMGTGILAISLVAAPVHIPGGAWIGRGLFVADVVLFVLFSALWLAQTLLRPEALAASFAHVAKAQPWGAPPMACFTVAVGFLVIGPAFVTPSHCVAIAQALWCAGVVLSLVSAFVVPYLMIARYELAAADATGAWLLPVVPPIVASVPAALLVRTWPAGFQAASLAVAYALLGIGLALAAIIVCAFYSRLLFAKIPEGALVTTMWLVVGPLGQSVAGMIALGAAARGVWPQLGTMLEGAGILYGLLTWGFGLFWLALALFATLRAALRGVPFTLGWWALTFPVGTLISGSFALYRATQTPFFADCGMMLLVLLTVNWTIVATRSLRHAYRALTEVNRTDEPALGVRRAAFPADRPAPGRASRLAAPSSRAL